MLTRVVETIPDRLRIGRRAKDDRLFKQRAVGNSTPSNRGEIKLFAGEEQLEEEILRTELPNEIGTPNKVEASARPRSLCVLAVSRRSPDERSQGLRRSALAKAFAANGSSCLKEKSVSTPMATSFLCLNNICFAE
jgi:hypothetical protein